METRLCREVQRRQSASQRLL